MDLDYIVIDKMKGMSTVGVYPRERFAKQVVGAKVVLGVSPVSDKEEDSLSSVVNYETVYQMVCEQLGQNTFYLLEKLALKIVNSCWAIDSRIQTVELTLEKPQALEKGALAKVIIFRRRSV